MDYDIDPLLEQWPHKPGEVTVRRITGRDGRPKIQMRLDLGLLQMEIEHRPDGRRPHGCKSLLAYHQGRLARYKKVNGVELGFEISSEQCRALREEAVMYYYRYLSLFILGEYRQVVSDTQRNLEAFDFCRKFAANRSDRFCLEQYRPYVLMINSRARVQLAVDDDKIDQALTICQQGIDRIKEFFKQLSSPQLAEQSSELAILQSLRAEICRKLPVDPVQALNADLAKAVEREQYEKAAKLRDRLRNMQSPNPPSPEPQSDN